MASISSGLVQATIAPARRASSAYVESGFEALKCMSRSTGGFRRPRTVASSERYAEPVRKAQTEIAQREGDIGTWRVDFGQQPGAASVRREELHDGKEVGLLAAASLHLLAARRSAMAVRGFRSSRVSCQFSFQRRSFQRRENRCSWPGE